MCIRDELMIATKTSFVVRYAWNGTQNRDYSLDLRRIPFSVDQQLSTSATPLTTENTYISAIEYSPLVGGFSIVLNCGRAAFLTAQTLKFDPNQVQGVWAKGLNDATCTALNHKYRLIAFGRKNSQGIVLYVDETTGSLEVSHNLVLSTKDYPGVPGSVVSMRWTPDSSAIALAWSSGGIAIWSTFGALLLCTLKWDYGLNLETLSGNPFHIVTMEWSAEGYQLWMLKDSYSSTKDKCCENMNYQVRSVVQWEFVKSPLTVNPCMSNNGHIYLQGEDRLYINLGHKVFSNNISVHIANGNRGDGFCHALSGTKQWLVIPIPNSYVSCNWPIRFTAIDEEGLSIAVAGRTGLAHYSMLSRKWKLFGNEYQERDFVVTGGLLWYQGYLVTSSYSIPDDEDEIRIYPRDVRLDNHYVRSIRMESQVLLLNMLKTLLLVFCANSQIRIYNMVQKNEKGGSWIELIMMQTIDVSRLSPHPACVVSANLTLIRTEVTEDNVYPETLLLNVSGKLLMVQRDHWQENAADSFFTCAAPTVLASSVENLWIPWKCRKDKRHLTETVWLFCGAHGMRVWLPLYPKSHHDKVNNHTFLLKRVMLPFNLKIYPLTILFEDAILLGADNDTVLYTSDTSSPFIIPFSILELTSQVYLHQILRQLIHRNLGRHAWEIARSCSSLPYFSHSLELLLHEVLEEEATSKEPLPDAQLPSIVEFIQEFPGFWARAIVQCARKTEIALWPYLFSIVGPPKKLLQTCLDHKELDTAASYLLILQNLEASSVSKQYATLLLDAALEQGRWELSKDLVRFLRAIDPNDIDMSKTSAPIIRRKRSQSPLLSPQEDDLSLIMGTTQVSRSRSYSTASTPKLEHESPYILDKPKKSVAIRKKSSTAGAKIERSESCDGSAEDFFIDVILERHARRLLTSRRLLDLGSFAAQLNFHLVVWMAREKDRVAKVTDYIVAIKAIHDQFAYPYPLVNLLEISKLTNEELDFPYGRYPNLPNIRSFVNYVSPADSLNTRSSNLEANRSFRMLNDSHSIISDNSTLIWGDEQLPTVDNSTEKICWTSMNSIEETELNNAHFLNDYAVRADVQLRYLLHLFLEAGCLGWAVTIAIVLGDASAVARTVCAAHAPMQTLDSMINLRDGLAKLVSWSHTECLGYKQFLTSIQGQIGLLQRLIQDKQQNQADLHHQSSEENRESVLEPSNSSSPYVVVGGGAGGGNAMGSSSRRSSISCVSGSPNYKDESLNELAWSGENSYASESHEDKNANAVNSSCALS